jgi:indole-3-acetate monooxygenase
VLAGFHFDSLRRFGQRLIERGSGACNRSAGSTSSLLGEGMITSQSPPSTAMPVETAVVDAAQRLVSRVRAARDECEALRRVPTAMADALGEAGLLQMYLPRSMGGPELSPLVVFRAVEEISRADGSVGWCTMIATAISSSMGWLPPEVGQEMAGSPADLRLAGSIRPQGRARRVDGGYRVEGRWDFASGVHHARWLMCPCVIWDGEKPMRAPSGAPITRIFWVPARNGEILDTWHVLGLRGSGSHDFTIADVFVPDRYSVSATDSPLERGLLYDSRLHLSWIWTATAANALGIGRGALDTFADLASRSTTMSTLPLRDRPLAQTRIAEAEAILNSARAYLHAAVTDLWSRAGQGQSDLDAAIVQARLAITHAMHEAVRCVDLVFHAAGTNAVYEQNRLERDFRNIHVAVQHAAGLPAHMHAAGKALLGLRPDDPGW